MVLVLISGTVGLHMALRGLAIPGGHRFSSRKLSASFSSAICLNVCKDARIYVAFHIYDRTYYTNDHDEGFGLLDITHTCDYTFIFV